MKKILSVLLAVSVFAVFMCPVLTLAAGDPAFEISSVSAKAGEDFKVTVSLKNNPGIVSAKLSVAFDADITLKNVTYGEKLGGNTQQPQKLDSPVTLNWISPAAELKTDEVYATLTFSASKSAVDGDHKIEVSYNPNDVFNLAEKNIEFKVEGGIVTVSGGASASDTAKSTDTDTTTIGATENRSDGNGDYIGEDEIIEGDDEVNITEKALFEKETTPIWIFAVMAAFFIVAAALIIILKKRAGKKPEE